MASGRWACGWGWWELDPMAWRLEIRTRTHHTLCLTGTTMPGARRGGGSCSSRRGNEDVKLKYYKSDEGVDKNDRLRNARKSIIIVIIYFYGALLVFIWSKGWRVEGGFFLRGEWAEAVRIGRQDPWWPLSDWPPTRERRRSRTPRGKRNNIRRESGNKKDN